MKIKFNLFIISLFISLLLLPGILSAASVNLNATATIEAATLNASQSNGIDFGTIIISNQDSTVSIDASGGGATPAVTSGNASVTGGTSGLIDVTTNIDANVTITYPGTVIIDDGVPGNTMDISNITSNSTSSPLSITAGGTNEVHIGGDLAVTASQTSGTYTGTITIDINY
jgi:hypothetical protein